MSLIVFGTIAAISAASAGVAAALRQRRAARAAQAVAEAAPPKPAAPDPTTVALARAGLPFGLGDVIAVEADLFDGPTPSAVASINARRGQVERWLEGGCVAFDGAEVAAAVFLAPEGSAEGAVVAFAAPRAEIGWLAPIVVEVGGEPPATLELGGLPMRRRRRLAVRLERIGKGAPRVGADGVWAEYEASGRAFALVLRTAEGTFAWVGQRYDQGEYERMGSGAS